MKNHPAALAQRAAGGFCQRIGLTSAGGGRSLVNEVVANGTCLEEGSRRCAGQFLACSPAAVRCTKQIAMLALEPDCSRLPFGLFEKIKPVLFKLEDTREGMRAFAEKSESPSGRADEPPTLELC